MAFLDTLDYRVLWITDDDVRYNLDGIVDPILVAIHGGTAPSP